MKKRKTKKEAQLAHARRRAEQRYGIHFNKATSTLFKKKLGNNGSIPLEKQSNRTCVHLIKHDGQMFKVVYDKSRSTFVTFLPMSWQEICGYSDLWYQKKEEERIRDAQSVFLIHGKTKFRSYQRDNRMIWKDSHSEWALHDFGFKKFVWVGDLDDEDFPKVLERYEAWKKI